jgi:hypothetical protein
MKKLFLIVALSLTALTATAQLTPEEKKDQMRPVGMVQVGTEGNFDVKEDDNLGGGTLIRKYKLKGKIVGYRFYVFGTQSYRYYWIPKHCKCSQEYRKINE